MCGIFGAIGRDSNPGIIRALALINRERGDQSLGFFSSNGKMVKSATDPLRALTYSDFDTYITRACSGGGWFIAGHTRHATHGARNNRNAHPFRFGRIIGSHNGVVNYPLDRKYQVDSEYLIDQLNRHNGNVQAALADVEGYWGLTWFDGEHFYIAAHDNTVYVGRPVGSSVWYYSSDREHLVACIGKTDKIECIEKGRVIRFDAMSAEFTEMPTFRSVAKKLEKRWWTGGAKVTVKSVTTAAPIVPAAPGVPYVLPTAYRADSGGSSGWRDDYGRMEGYGHASTDDRLDDYGTNEWRGRVASAQRARDAEAAGPFDSEDNVWTAKDCMDWDEFSFATDMAWELGYSSLDEYLTVNCYDNDDDLDAGLDMLDWEYHQVFGDKTEDAESAEDAEFVDVDVDADIPF